MNKEEIEELKDFTIDLTDIDELALGLEVCSKKSNMVIQEFADTIIQLQQENNQLKEELKYTVPIVEHNKIVSKKLKENQKYKEVIDKLKNKTKENIENAKCEITTLTIGDKAYYQYIEKMLDNYIDILKEVE